MKFTQFLIEATNLDNAYTSFHKAYSEHMGDNVPSPSQLLGLMNRRTHKDGSDTSLDFTTNWLLNKGFLQRKGSVVTPTQKGSQLRQILSKPHRDVSDERFVNVLRYGNWKDKRRFNLDMMDTQTREWAEKQSDETLEAVAIANELDKGDLAYLIGIRDKVENHKERQHHIQSNPDRLDKMIELGFINPKTLAFNKQKYDMIADEINAIDPGIVRYVVPQFSAWARKSIGDKERNVNSILFAIHPNSRTNTEEGRQIYRILKNVPDNVYTMLKNNKKPPQGELSNSAYNILIDPVRKLIQTYKHANNAEELVQALDDDFISRINHKGHDRDKRKVRDRRDAIANTISSFR